MACEDFIAGRLCGVDLCTIFLYCMLYNSTEEIESKIDFKPLSEILFFKKKIFVLHTTIDMMK